MDFDLAYGMAGSCGDKYYVEDDSKIHMGACNGSVEFVYGEFDVNEENFMEDIMECIKHFNISIE